MDESYQCVVKVCGAEDELLIGAIYWREGYLPFAMFPYRNEIYTKGTEVLKPELVGAYKKIEFYGVDIRLKAVNPTFMQDVEASGAKDEDLCFFDLSVFEAWLRKSKMEIPEPIGKIFFKKIMEVERKKALFESSQSKFTII